MENKYYFQYLFAGLIRFWLINTDYQKTIADRIEVSTPLNSWKRGIASLAMKI